MAVSKEQMEDVKDKGISISMASLGAAIPVMLAAWFLIKPAVVVAVGEQLKGQVKQTVNDEIKPINTALSIILRSDVDNLKRQIAAMEYKRDFPPNNDWSDSDSRSLAQLKLDLRSSEAALAALKDED